MSRRRPDLVEASLEGLVGFAVWFGCVCAGLMLIAVAVTVGIGFWRLWLWMWP